MKNMNAWNKWITAGALLMLAAGGGCESAKESMRKQAERDAFPAEDDARPYRRFAAAQAGVGARHDGMLYAYHFDGDRLNSLGESKLSSMLQANDTAWPMVVYMNVPAEGAGDAAQHLKSREDAVSQYLADRGLQEGQFRFVPGPNPDATSSGAQNLARLSKTESESPVASNPTNSSTPGYGTGGGSGGDGGGGGGAGK
jgi:hypothetical protein